VLVSDILTYESIRRTPERLDFSLARTVFEQLVSSETILGGGQAMDLRLRDQWFRRE